MNANHTVTAATAEQIYCIAKSILPADASPETIAAELRMHKDSKNPVRAWFQDLVEKTEPEAEKVGEVASKLSAWLDGRKSFKLDLPEVTAIVTDGQEIFGTQTFETREDFEKAAKVAEEQTGGNVYLSQKTFEREMRKLIAEKAKEMKDAKDEVIFLMTYKDAPGDTAVAADLPILQKLAAKRGLTVTVLDSKEYGPEYTDFYLITPEELASWQASAPFDTRESEKAIDEQAYEEMLKEGSPAKGFIDEKGAAEAEAADQETANARFLEKELVPADIPIRSGAKTVKACLRAAVGDTGITRTTFVCRSTVLSQKELASVEKEAARLGVVFVLTSSPTVAGIKNLFAMPPLPVTAPEAPASELASAAAVLSEPRPVKSLNAGDVVILANDNLKVEGTVQEDGHGPDVTVKVAWPAYTTKGGNGKKATTRSHHIGDLRLVKVAEPKAKAPKAGKKASSEAATVAAATGPVVDLKAAVVTRWMAGAGYKRLEVCKVLTAIARAKDANAPEVKNVPWTAWKEGLAGKDLPTFTDEQAAEIAAIRDKQ